MFHNKKKRIIYISISLEEIVERPELQGVDVFQVSFLTNIKNYEFKIDEIVKQIKREIKEHLRDD